MNRGLYESSPSAYQSTSPPQGQGNRFRTVGYLLCMTVVIALFFSPALVSSRQFLFQDTGRAHHPMKRYIAEEFRQGRFPSWNPYSGLGTPLVAGAIDAVQHPFNLLLLPSFEIGFKLWVVLSYLLAAWGGFFWCRVLGRSRLASTGGGLVFALSGVLVSQSNNIQYLTAFASLPWIFAAVHRWIVLGRPGQLALAAAASAFSAAAGDPQSWGIAIMMIPLYAAMVTPTVGRRTLLLRAGLAVAASLAAAAPFILPVAAWISHSSRGQELLIQDYQRFNLHWRRIFEFVVPNLFRGEPGPYNEVFTVYAGNAWTHYPWVLSVYLGAVSLLVTAAGGIRERFVRLFLVTAAVFLWMAMGPNGGFVAIVRHIPVLSGFRYWEKLTVWPTLFVSIAASFGIDHIAWNRRRAWHVAVFAAAVAGISLAVAGFFIGVPDFASAVLERDGFRAAAEALIGNLRAGFLHIAVACILLSVVCYMIKRNIMPKAAPAFLVCVLILDVAVANRHAYILGSSSLLASAPLATTYVRTENVPRVIVPFGPQPRNWPGLSTWEKETLWWKRTLETPWNVPNHIGNFLPYTGMIQNRLFTFEKKTDFKPTLLTGLWDISSVIVPDSPEAAAQVGVRPPFQVLGVDPGLPAFAVEIPHRPRAYLAEKIFETDETGSLRFALDPNTISSHFVVVEGPVITGADSPQGLVRFTKDEPSRTELEVTSDRPALLVLNDAFAPGWSAFLDGRRTEIVRANYLVRGVWVAPGTHSIVFVYHTPLLREGWAVFFLGFAALGLWAVRSRNRNTPLQAAG